MPLFYKGSGVGTYWHGNNAQQTGFTAQFPGMASNISILMGHIAHSRTQSPYISLTRSSGVAWEYAIYGGHNPPTPNDPAFIYEIQLDDPLPHGLSLIDPIMQIAASLPTPSSHTSYQHDGHQSYLLGVVDPLLMNNYLKTPVKQPPFTQTSSLRIPNHPNAILEMLVHALRDAEILATGIIPRSCVINRFPVW